MKYDACHISKRKFKNILEWKQGVCLALCANTWLGMGQKTITFWIADYFVWYSDANQESTPFLLSFWANMQRFQHDLEDFSKWKLKYNLKQELCMPALTILTKNIKLDFFVQNSVRIILILGWLQSYCDMISSLHWLFDCFLCCFSSSWAYSEWTSPFCLRHRFILYLAKRFHFLASRFYRTIDIYILTDVIER